MHNVSYFCNCSGTNVTCFTFYNDYGRLVDFSDDLEATLLAVIMLTSLTCNALVVYATVLRSGESPPPGATNYLVANLAVADFLFALTIPLVMSARLSQGWPLGQVACKLTIYMQCLCGSVVMWSLCLISVDRFRCIVVPPFRPRLNRRQTATLVGLCWLAFLLVQVPILMLFGVEKGHDKEAAEYPICTMVPRYSSSYGILYVGIITTTIFIVPTAIFIVNYVRIYLKLTEMDHQQQQRSRLSAMASTATADTAFGDVPLEMRGVGLATSQNTVDCKAAQDASGSRFWRRRSSIWSNARSWPALAPVLRMLSVSDLRVNPPDTRSEPCLSGGAVPVTPTGEEGENGSMEAPRRHLHALKILVIEVVAYLLMWLPLTILLIVMYFESTMNCDGRLVESHHFFYCLVLAYANTCVNPILYGALNDNFRHSLRRKHPCHCSAG